MTTLPLEPHTEAEEARLKRIEGAEPAEESVVVRVAQAIRDSNGTPEAHAAWKRHPQLIPAHVYAAAAIGAMKGPSPAEEALARVEAMAERLGDESREFYYDNRHTHEYGISYVSGMSDAMEQIADRITAAIAAPVAQAGEGR